MVYSLMGLFLLALGCASTPTPKRGPLNPELVVDGVYEGSATIWPVKAVVQVAIENLLDRFYKVFASGLGAPGRNFVLTFRAKI